MEAWPFLAKNGYAAIEVWPISAKIGHAVIGESTLTADRVLFPIGEYPFLAENGYATTGA